jgi:hypothetical protein
MRIDMRGVAETMTVVTVGGIRDLAVLIDDIEIETETEIVTVTDEETAQ